MAGFRARYESLERTRRIQTGLFGRLSLGQNNYFLGNKDRFDRDGFESRAEDNSRATSLLARTTDQRRLEQRLNEEASTGVRLSNPEPLELFGPRDWEIAQGGNSDPARQAPLNRGLDEGRSKESE